jgi:predicted glycosyltransferase
MDYEHQPANHVAFRAASRVLVPRALPAQALARQGAGRRKLVRYDGFKEEIYLGGFQPDPGVRSAAGVADLGERALVVARTSPAGASYHRDESPRLRAALERLGARDDVVCVALARHPEQAAELRALRLENLLVPDAAVDARSLLWGADAFLGAGGTMTREAALLGVPAYSLFAGPPSAVDAELQRRGLLRELSDPGALDVIKAGARERRSLAELRERGAALTDLFAGEALAARR